MLRIHKKIRCLVDDCHRKLAKWLCENYHVVLLPEFRTQSMIRRGQRRIRSKTARAMCTWSHYRFRQHLIHKAHEHPWCQIILCTEEYTSKTCGSCGCIHRGLGGSKVFRCPSCVADIDRDINGARNILLRYLTVNQKEPASAGVGAYPLGS
jgi:putative transposase